MEKKNIFEQDLIILFVLLVEGVDIEFDNLVVSSLLIAENGTGKAGDTCAEGTETQPSACYN